MRSASPILVTAQRGPSEKEKEEGVLLEILSLFTDFVKPSKRDEFVVILLKVLEYLDLDL